MAELDGPRLEPRSGPAQPAGRVPARLWRRRQRPDRHRPRLAGPACPTPRSCRRTRREPCGQAPIGREWFPLTFRDPERALGRRQRGGARAQRIPRRRTRAPQSAAVGARAGRLQPRHHDGAACRPAPRRRRRRRSSAIPACWCCRTRPSPRAFAAEIKSQAAGAADPRRSRTSSFRCRRCSCRARAGRARGPGGMAHLARRRPRHRPGRPAPRRRIPRQMLCSPQIAALVACLAGNSPSRLHNPVTLPITRRVSCVAAAFQGGRGASLERARVARWISGPGAQRGLPAAELLPAFAVVLAGRDQGGVPRTREHRRQLRPRGAQPLASR